MLYAHILLLLSSFMQKESKISSLWAANIYRVSFERKELMLAQTVLETEVFPPMYHEVRG
jgi:hypothetical protein